MRRRSSSGYLKSIIVLIVFVAIAMLLWLQRQYIVDQISVWQYTPSSDVKQIAEQSGMNENGTFLFYASHPSIEDAASFNKNCSRKETSAAILGCYNGQNIFIYNVQDERLTGIREVTAAHEMLHAAYARLESAERERLRILLAAEYEKLKDDKDFSERMAFYERTEPGERDNELHSIIGTEFQPISSELEAYYKKYFVNRSNVVAIHEKYAAVFADLQRRGEQIVAQITQLAAAIERDSTRYNNDVAQLNQDITAFNAKANSGQFVSQSAFQAERSSLLERARQLDLHRKDINNSITEYNRLRDDLAAVSMESDALNRSINSSLAPAPSL